MKKKKISKVLGHDAGLTPMVRKGDWQLARENPERGGKHKVGTNKQTGAKNGLSKETKLEIAKEKAGGASEHYLAKKYGVSITYVQDSLKSIFLTSKVGREILKNVILENGIACGMHARTKVEELSGMQAIMATGIMSSKFVELEKHTMAQPAEVDFVEIQAISENLKAIKDLVGDLPDDSVVEIIDLEE